MMVVITDSCDKWIDVMMMWSKRGSRELAMLLCRFLQDTFISLYEEIKPNLKVSLSVQR